MVVPGDGPRRVAAFVATVVCSDTGGYAVGVFIGKHPMAPSVSPKKSWEGFGGSVAACAVQIGDGFADRQLENFRIARTCSRLELSSIQFAADRCARRGP